MRFEADIFFCHFGPFFALSPRFLPFCSPMDPENQNFETVKKNAWRYYHFTKMYHEWQSYDVWFLRYGARRTFWTVFFPPNPPSPNHQNQNFEKWKNTWRYHVTQMHQKSWSYATFFKIRCVTDVIFIFHFELFFVLPLRHPTIQKIKI